MLLHLMQDIGQGHVLVHLFIKLVEPVLHDR